MDHRDAEICDITIVLKCDSAEIFEQALEQLKAAGLAIDSADPTQCIVDGSIESCDVHHIEKMSAVRYVRRVLTYVADYPPGDPRNLDPEEAVEDDQPE